jgi:hypothetical protein
MKIVQSNGYCHECGNDYVDILCITAEQNDVSVDICNKCFNIMMTFVPMAFKIT